MPHNDHRYDCQPERRPRARWYALGLGAVLVVEAAQGIAPRHLQRLAETVAGKPFFRESFKRKRCLIPVSGYYVWQDTSGGKQPYYFTARDGSPSLTIAGLRDDWHDTASGETLKSCTMIITEPNEFAAEVHDRMPVLLTEKDFGPWLRGSAGMELLKPAANDLLQRWPVSKRVNSSKAPAEDATLIDRIAL